MNYEDRIRKFLINNPDIVSEYENTPNNMSIENSLFEIADCCEKYIKVSKTQDINQTIRNAFDIAIKHEVDILEAFDMLISRKTTDDDSSNSIQQYFKEINNIYVKNDHNYDIEYCEGNRDKLIEMNLKSVISIAKNYQGLGLTLSELISAGNLGLVIAFDKFDPSKSKLKDNMLNSIGEFPDEFSGAYLEGHIKDYLKYGDVKKKINPLLKQQSITKRDLIKWIEHNIKNAKFNSVAVMWIKAYILIEIDNYSRLVKKPKSEIYKDKEEFGSYKKEVTLDIDAPVTDESKTLISDILRIEDETENELDTNESYLTFKEGLYKLLDGVKSRDKNIFLKKFGIGLPRPLLPKEIAEQEGLSIARVSQIFQTVTEQMQKNSVKFNIDPSVLFAAVRKIQ